MNSQRRSQTTKLCSALTRGHFCGYIAHGHKCGRSAKGYVGGVARFRIAKGVSFSVGRAVPISRDELVTLGEGSLYATNKRVLFAGAGQNTSILLSRISEIEVFREAACFGKDRGKDDYFLMSAFQSIYVRSLVGALFRLNQ
jgi:hypothetical protein